MDIYESELLRRVLRELANQSPGMGSTANALPHQNPIADERAYYTDMEDDGRQNYMLGMGVGLGSQMLPANPVTLAGALGGLGYGMYGVGQQFYGKQQARKRAYQGS